MGPGTIRQRNQESDPATVSAFRRTVNGGRRYADAVPTYVFRCAEGCVDFTERHPMSAIPDAARCPSCAASARRIVGAPALGVGDSAAMRLQDATRATADRPSVVTGLPASSRRTPTSSNPWHRKLPRP